MARRDSLLRRSFALRSDDLGRRVVGGAGYQFLGIGLRTLLTLGSTAILARLLSPSDFGYVAMATVVTEFAGLLGAFGFANVLIQRRVINRLQLDTVFWASMAIGTVLGLFVFAASFGAGLLFDDPTVGPLLRVMALNFVIGSATTVPSVVLARLMRFKANFWINMLTVVIRTVAAVACAFAGLGMWSLVIGALVGTVANTALYFACAPYLPRWRYHGAFIARTWRTSAGYFGNTALYYVNMNLDLLLIGRQLGAAPLGYYQNARSLTEEIRGRIAMPIQQVLFPAFSALQADPERFRQLVLRAGRLLAAVVVPIGFGVSANAQELVLVLYGEQWRAMIPVMAMFGLSAALRAGTAIASPLFNANDRVGLAFRYNAAGTVLTIAGVLAAMPFGIEVVAASVALTSLYVLLPARTAFGLIGLGSRHLLQVLGPPVAAAALMWLATSALRATWTAPPALALALHVGAGAVVYLVALHLLARQFLQDFRQAFALLRSRA
ncbi:lipopolysaccharide biosynthesis protein [Rubrivivax benzoatilyticus]|uniref:Lipopolysaccharide biosynthesis protein n=1 Tax=Rubrivivax benzoatilyticus TaxID=316997 RepID=A0ABX0HYB0_9BURK|nr:lipopolysaccharide biosynthesis protein [Rubrivivax benzoatilyticus]EGJ09800.1 polysaccharide biosynthesis protein [Rubrivivax benzoatilyticus JA2 = ATCC BAA-35]NHK99415.1 lipopolysaccharide biosynthesis protein [Rubrivivax benzoatilyticus]NHL25289.1 lipopolysaccharide biosynthesis protein [Rubrivivax benzoatilyticus]